MSKVVNDSVRYLATLTDSDHFSTTDFIYNNINHCEVHTHSFPIKITHKYYVSVLFIARVYYEMQVTKLQKASYSRSLRVDFIH